MLYLGIVNHYPDSDDGREPYSVLVAAFDNSKEAWKYRRNLCICRPYEDYEVKEYDADIDSADLGFIAYDLDLELDLVQDRMHLYGYYNKVD